MGKVIKKDVFFKIQEFLIVLAIFIIFIYLVTTLAFTLFPLDVSSCRAFNIFSNEYKDCLNQFKLTQKFIEIIIVVGGLIGFAAGSLLRRIQSVGIALAVAGLILM